MIIGHSKQISYLERLIERKQVGHAFVFSGPEHLGKRLIASWFFWTIAKNKYDFFSSRDTLAQSLRGGTSSHPDVFFLTRESEKKLISIESIRELKHFASLAPFALKEKFVLIDNAHELSPAAFNSLLKTFEEPKSNTIFVLITSKYESLPITIRSRAINIRFYPLTNEDLEKGLKEKGMRVRKSDYAWVAGRPGLILKESGDSKLIFSGFKEFGDWLKNPTPSMALDIAEKAASYENTPAVIEGWMHAANAMESPRRGFIIRKLNELLKVIETTTANKRLQIESILFECMVAQQEI